MSGAATGRAGEDRAQEVYEKMGFRVVARNYRVRSGEIDLIVVKSEALVFVEVKTRSRRGPVDAAFFVDRRKQERIRKAAGHFLLTHPEYQGHDCRFDVVCFVLEENSTRRIENAFF